MPVSRPHGHARLCWAEGEAAAVQGSSSGREEWGGEGFPPPAAINTRKY